MSLHLGSSMIAATTSHLAECPDLGPECAGPSPPIPYYHHVALVLADVSLDASYGLAPWLAAEARISLRIADFTPTYTELDGSQKLVPDDIHHHDETLVGPSDPWLVLRAGAAWGGLITSARFGLTVPLGRTEPNPYVLGARGETHEHSQFGTGTLAPIVGLSASYAWERVELAMSALGLFSVYANAEGFRAPSRYFLNVRAAFPLLDGALRPSITIDIPHETEEIWDGSPGLEGSNIRTDILIGAGLAWRFAPPWTADIAFRARAATLREEASFEYPGIIELGLSTEIDLAGGSKTKAK